MRGLWGRLSFVVSLAVAASAAQAQEGVPPKPHSPADDVEWVAVPGTGKLGEHSTVHLAEGWKFTGAKGAQVLLEAMQNPISHREQGMAFPPPGEGEWFAVFEFNPIGYVEDKDKDDLDADAILASIREGNDAANEERTRRGWTTLQIEGWDQPPHYDGLTHNLEWAVRARGTEGAVVNYNVRLLGREGVMEVALVGTPEALTIGLPTFRKLLATHEFVAGREYGSYRAGDKVAQYGLAGLVAGGALAVAAKTGLLQKLWKFIVFGIVALVAWIRRLFAPAGAKPSAVRRPKA